MKTVAVSVGSSYAMKIIDSNRFFSTSVTVSGVCYSANVTYSFRNNNMIRYFFISDLFISPIMKMNLL